MNEVEIEQAHQAAREKAAALKTEVARADTDTLRLMFTEARTHYDWRDTPVTDQQLRDLYEIAKMGPTSMNQQPMRLVFVRSAEAKEKLKPALAEPNVPKMMAAPVTAIVAYDLAFFEKLPKVFPMNPQARDRFAGDEAMAQTNGFRNGTLQGAYLMLAARAVGLDVGAMSGFNNAAVDEAFFAGTTIKSNFLCNLGYADEAKIFRRLPRLDFDEIAEIA